jgi:hypothetical protein
VDHLVVAVVEVQVVAQAVAAVVAQVVEEDNFNIIL